MYIIYTCQCGCCLISNLWLWSIKYQIKIHDWIHMLHWTLPLEVFPNIQLAISNIRSLNTCSWTFKMLKSLVLWWNTETPGIRTNFLFQCCSVSTQKYKKVPSRTEKKFSLNCLHIYISTPDLNHWTLRCWVKNTHFL